MKPIILFWLLFSSFAFFGKTQKATDSPMGYLSQKNYKELSPRYREWLNMVTYIATTEEKKVFLQLTGDRDRDLFMRIFWNQRDPSPATEENEYRREIEARFAHVNSIFARGSVKPGWMTDRGRIYMILGNPETIESFDSEPGLFPAQVWHYKGENAPGIPPYFHLTFFRRLGQGEWALYDPVGDGPAALLENGETYESSDYKKLYERIRQLAPTLAIPSLSLVPGQIPPGYSPSLQSGLLMANIFLSPTRRIHAEYADRFLNYKGMVSVETSLQFIDCAFSLSLFKQNRFNGYFLHYAVKPKKISLDYDPDTAKYSLHFKLVANLKKNENIFFQQTRRFDLDLNKEELAILKAGGLVLEDAFPAIPGDFRLALFIENETKKEFSYQEIPISVPNAPTIPRLLTPALGFRLLDIATPNFGPYAFAGQKLLLDPENIFATGDPLIVAVSVDAPLDRLPADASLEWILKSDSREKPFMQNARIPLPGNILRPDNLILFSLPAAFPGSGYYRLTLKLCGASGLPWDEKSVNLSVSPIHPLSRPTEIYNCASGDNPFQFDYIRGLQYFQASDMPSASRAFDESLLRNPDFLDAERMRLETAIQLGQYGQVLERAERLNRDPNLLFDMHRLKGQAYFGQGEYRKALESFLSATQIFPNDFQLINLIGRTYLQLGDIAEARRALEASLRLNPDQPAIRDLLAKCAIPQSK